MENPSTHSDLELFTREFKWDSRSTISKLYWPTFGGAFALGVAVFGNYLQRKPVFSGNV